MKTIYFNSEFSAEVFFFSYYTKFFQNAYVSEMFVQETNHYTDKFTACVLYTLMALYLTPDVLLLTKF